MSFEHLSLIAPIAKAIKEVGYTHPTPIQEQSIPVILQHKDLIGCARTGTGKTAAFAIPVLQLLYNARQAMPDKRGIKALILTPTRELALQIQENIETYGKYTGIKSLVIFGGVSQSVQVNGLRRGVDILIATPGRLKDLMQQGHISLRSIELLVLDEADRMLDMGFIHEVKRIIQVLPANRQTLFFSATMAPQIRQLADSILNKPVSIEVSPVSSTATTVEQQLYYVVKKDKAALLLHLLEDQRDIESVLVFTRTKHGADKITKVLNRSGVRSEAIHGNKSQQARVRALHLFKNRQIKVLVATDIAARGIDIDQLSHVINFDLPNVPETYVHRIGRTGRAGANGKAFSFCDPEEKAYLADIQHLTRKTVPVVQQHPFAYAAGNHQQHTTVAKNTNSAFPRQQQQRYGQRKNQQGNRFNNRSTQPATL